MNQGWRIKVHGKPRQNPDIALLVRVVLALAEQLQREVDEAGDGLVNRPITETPETT